MGEAKNEEARLGRISVIIPCYNDEGTLAMCVESVRRQSFSASEVIVVDDCSTDGSLQVAESLNVTVVRPERNGGPSVARNLGAEHASGTCLFFLDSDVALEPGSLAAARDHLARAAGTGAICGVLDYESLLNDHPLQRYRAIQLHSWWTEKNGEEGVSEESSLTGLHSALFAIRADVFRQVGGFDTALRVTEEQDLGHRLRGSGYDVRVTDAIRGRHNHDASLRVLLPKVLERSRIAGPLGRWRERGVPGGSRARALAGALVLSAATAVPLALLLGPSALLLAATLAALTVLLDHRRHRHAFRRHGIRFGLYFTGVHMLVNLTAATGTAVGFLEGLLPGRRPGRTAGKAVLARGDTSGGGGKTDGAAGPSLACLTALGLTSASTVQGNGSGEAEKKNS
ncbi:glycosyltransferase family 2 protein [Streptomyces sp. PmtG]